MYDLGWQWATDQPARRSNAYDLWSTNGRHQHSDVTTTAAAAADAARTYDVANKRHVNGRRADYPKLGFSRYMKVVRLFET